MTSGHLQRTGYRHAVLAVAALSALVAAMYTQSSFTDPLSKTEYISLSILGDAYTEPHRFAIAIIVLNTITCALTAVMSLVIDWHFAIRVPAYIEFSWFGVAWAALARRPTYPIDLWNTPLPKNYPISPHETQKKDDPVFFALDDSQRGAKPEDSIAMDPYSLIFRPTAVKDAQRVAQEGVKVHELPVVNVIAPIEDQGAAYTQDNASQATLHTPPGLEKKTGDHLPYSSSD
ncbi:hypothetical protein OPQ81_008833 [Rhizoctonia solani]|nr:hypothetical protein OPQ81_008833 [Rhizoctonia solani]